MDQSQQVAKKVYYSIGEVCDLSGLKPHVLRYWETQFDVLNPTKNRAGNRVYRSRDVEVVLLGEARREYLAELREARR